jgi:thiol peroxidase
MTKHLNDLVKKNPGLMVITISADLPFAQKRFCEGENVHSVLTLSMMRNKEFGKNYGLLVEEGVLAGLLARAVILLDEKDHVLYVELVPEVTQEPDYHALTKALQR